MGGREWWFKVARYAIQPPIEGQCTYIYPNRETRCGQRLSEKHGEGKWCYAHSHLYEDGTRGVPMTPHRKRRQMEREEQKAADNREIMRRVRAKQDETVLQHLTDAAHKIAPCPDTGVAYPPYTELAAEFRHFNKRWPLWWEMAILIYEYEKDKKDGRE